MSTCCNEIKSKYPVPFQRKRHSECVCLHTVQAGAAMDAGC